MIKKVLESFEACGIDYTKPMTSEDLVAVTGYCERLSEGAISYGKFMAALYMAGIKLTIDNNPKKKRNTAPKEEKEKANRQPVRMLTVDGKPIKEFVSVREAAKYIRGDASSISAVLNGKLHTCYGYRWERIEKEKGSV